MPEKGYTEKWKEFCYYLSRNLKSDISESQFEYDVLMGIEKLGWSQYNDEVKVRPTVHIGNNNSVEPDIVLYNPEGKPLIVIEIKRPTIEIDIENTRKQLWSYMYLLKANFGLLIGKEIIIFYDGDKNGQKDPLQLDKFQIDPQFKDGHSFISAFSKNEFLNNQYQPYLARCLDDISKKRNVSVLVNRLLSSDTKDKLIDFIMNDFAEFGEDVILEALNTVSINITTQEIPLTPTASSKIEIKKTKLVKTKDITKPNSISSLSGKMLTIDKLSQLDQDVLGHSRPNRLQIGNHNYNVSYWVDVCKFFVKYLIENNYLNLNKVPIPNAAQYGKYFIISETERNNINQDAKWDHVDKFYVDTKYQAFTHVKNIAFTLVYLDVPKLDIKISFA